MDGTTSLKWPLFSVNFAIVFDPALFNLDAISFADLTSLEPLLMGIMKETCVGVNELTAILGKQLLSVLTPIKCGMFC
jgi:hypothetical protein